jgi:hypothetical protein
MPIKSAAQKNNFAAQKMLLKITILLPKSIKFAARI